MPAASETRPVFGFASAGGAGVCACAVLATASAPNIIAATARRMLPIPSRLIVACPPVGCRRIRRGEQGACRTCRAANTHSYARDHSAHRARDKHARARCPFARHAQIERETETRPDRQSV